jgi:isovaleryl-CoA dehydrogenase
MSCIICFAIVSFLIFFSSASFFDFFFDVTRTHKGFCLNGTKMWITNGTLGNGNLNGPADAPYELGDLFLVYARTGPQRSDITQFVVEKGMPGFSLGSPIKDKLGMRASMTAELVFDNVLLDTETHVVGQVHQATLCMMRNLEMERLALAAMAVGIARRCIDEMKHYALHRTGLFGQSNLYAFGQVQQMIAESYAHYMAGKSYVYALAQAIDVQTKQQQQQQAGSGGGTHTHISNGLDADATKLYCAQMAKTVADHAIQVLGGNGYVAEYKVERLWRDAKLLEIGGGTSQSHHKNMSRDLRKMAQQGEKLP